MPLNTSFFRYRASILRARGDDTPAVPAVPGTPGIPGEPPHPGIPAGEGATWLLGSMSVNNDRPSVNFLSRGHFSWNFARWNDADRWASTGNVFTSANSMSGGISHVAISTLDQRGVDREAILQSIDTLKVTFLQVHGKTGLVVNIEFQISNREVLEATDAAFDDFMLFTVAADGFTTGEDPQVYPFTDFDMRVTPGQTPRVWGNIGEFSPWPSRIAILGTGGGTPGTPGTQDTGENRTVSQGTQRYTTHSTSGDALDPGEWSTDSDAISPLDETMTRIAPWTVGSQLRIYKNAPIGNPTPWALVDMFGSGYSIKFYASIVTDPNHPTQALLTVLDRTAIPPEFPFPDFVYIDVQFRNFNADWGDTVDIQIREFYRDIIPGDPPTPGEPPSPEIPPFGGTPDIPAIPGIPEIPKIDGDPPVYQLDRLDTLYAEYVQHQQYDTDGVYERSETWRIRKGAVELFDWLSMTDVMDPFTTDPNPFPTAELIEVRDVQPETRTFELVTGRRAIVPLSYDGFGGYFEDPGMRRYNPRGAAIFVPSDATPAPAPAPAQALVRFGWSQTQVASEGVLLRAGNHPVDGALLTSPNTRVHTPPFPPALVTDRSLYLHIWISGSADPTGIILGGDNQILGFGRIGELSVDGVAGILYVSNQRLSSGISAFFMEIQN